MQLSTSIVKGAAKGADAEAETWLATTDLADDPTAAIQLSRAITPDRYGFAIRRPLVLDSSDDRTKIVLDLLRAKQVPTADAVDALARSSHNSRKGATPTACDEQITHAKQILQAEGDALGAELSSAITLHRIDQNHGPTWQQAWAFDAVSNWWTPLVGSTPPFKPIGRTAFAMLHSAGWLASNQTARSLCPGRRFYVRFYGDHVSRMSPEVVGFAVAVFIRNYCRSNDDCSPTWAAIAASATDPMGVPLFFNATDAQAQQLWMVTQGWVRLDDNGCLCRGDRAKAEARRRTDLKAKHRSARITTAVGSTGELSE
ncbi:hypothetical protein ACLMAL_26240 [Nocardia sp. CWNU-33]|uniref:hypothetical protein n=1 Tax=Nocardia sp. CWNU-33 TaxID=3392117 RepID=UPI00398F7093